MKKISKIYVPLLVTMLLFLQVSIVNALNDNNSDIIYCLNAIQYFEKKYKIPKNLLYFISLVESGKYDPNSKSLQPWPWTININGVSKFFSNRKEMLMHIKNYLADGKENIDIGCSQINYKYHKQYFNNVEQMITPYYNVGYSAYYLYNNFIKTRNWNNAVALYHSKNLLHSQKYVQKIKKVAKTGNNLKLALSYIKKNKQHHIYNNYQQRELNAPILVYNTQNLEKR